MDVKILQLSALTNNIPTIKTYQKLGFVKIGDLPKASKYEGIYYDEIKMQKEI